MSKVTLVTGHYWGSKRRAGFHHLAQAYRKLGYEVLFFTAPMSYLLKIKGDYRFEYDLELEAGKLIQKEPHLHSYLHFTPWHPANFRLRLINSITRPFLQLYSSYTFPEAEQFIRESELIVFESTPGLFLFNRFRSINPSAKYIYRVSDDLRLLNVHPGLIRHEEKILKDFDLVSVPSEYIYRILAPYGAQQLRVNHHGINKASYDTEYANPYPKKDTKNIVFIGNDYFDHNFLRIASELYREYQFHIIGPIPDLPKRDNVIAYGEMPFSETIPYVKHADAGLHTLSYKTGSESFTDSLKVLQYTYCRLPIIAPEFLKTSRKNTFCYKPGDTESIKKVIEEAIESNKNDFTLEVKSWEEVALDLWETVR